MAGIQILLATYNGERFLQTQLDSLLAQTNSDWELLIRDDNSTDGTSDILERFAGAHPKQVRILRDDPDGIKPNANLGTKGNFNRLLAASNTPYIMFCDQDDHWHETKVDLTVIKMQEMEKAHGKDAPLLVHTDVALCDGELNVKAASLNHYRRMEKDYTPLQRVMVKNPVWGMSMMMNWALANKIGTFPEEDRMHDSWASKVAALVGHIGYIDIPLVDYRVHGDNVSTIQLPHSLPGRIARRLSRGAGVAFATKYREYNDMLENAASAARALLSRYGGEISGSQKALLTACCRLPEGSAWVRRRIITRYHLFPDHSARKWLETYVFTAPYRAA